MSRLRETCAEIKEEQIKDGYGGKPLSQPLHCFGGINKQQGQTCNACEERKWQQFIPNYCLNKQ